MKRVTPPRATEAANDASEQDLVTGEAADASIDDVDEEAGPDDEGDDEDDVPEDLAEETGIDLTDASDLDADNVPADEEFDRVMQAPD
ncbi:conserved hypothetical protein [Burkholderiales bacterium 8X]|nr:conserved hypothetical protein [Burkholderiales bacterium 8X]